jgi:hypothetical protein
MAKTIVEATVAAEQSLTGSIVPNNTPHIGITKDLNLAPRIDMNGHCTNNRDAREPSFEASSLIDRDLADSYSTEATEMTPPNNLTEHVSHMERLFVDLSVSLDELRDAAEGIQTVRFPVCFSAFCLPINLTTTTTQCTCIRIPGYHPIFTSSCDGRERRWI